MRQWWLHETTAKRRQRLILNSLSAFAIIVPPLSRPNLSELPIASLHQLTTSSILALHLLPQRRQKLLLGTKMVPQALQAESEALRVFSMGTAVLSLMLPNSALPMNGRLGVEEFGTSLGVPVNGAG